jgi:hypothetical protein
MSSPKTTIAGYLALVAAVLTLVVHILSGGFVVSDVTAIGQLVVGLGLIAARDDTR